VSSNLRREIAMSSPHFEDFAPTVWSAPPATYPDIYFPGMKGRWIETEAGILWTDDESSIGLDTTNAADWQLVAGIRKGLAEQFALNVPASELFSRLQQELAPEEWFDGDLAASGLTVAPVAE
jgi:hypothetical protein